MWELPPKQLELNAQDAHIWKAVLAAPHERIAAYLHTLADDERDRAARFHFESGRSSYVVARGILRELLGGYLGVEAAAVKLAYTSHGKPELDALHASGLGFNIAHSGELVLFAFARAARIGIDVERYRPDFDGQRIADRFFSEAESSSLRAVRESERIAAFTRQWTRKESFIKAHGEGLSYPLNAFAVIEDDAGALHVEIDGAPQTAGWHIRDIDVGGEYAAALTVEIPTPTLSTFAWE